MRLYTNSAISISALAMLLLSGPVSTTAQTKREARLSHFAAKPLAVSPSGSTAAERYAFGRLDLATGSAPRALRLPPSKRAVR